MLKKSHGVYTPAEVAQCAELSGAFSRDLGAAFGASLAGYQHSSRTQHIGSYASDVEQFVAEYRQDHLFDYNPG